MAVPPLRASDVWHRLSTSVRSRVTATSWVYPMYKRLPMGSTHSVHILMTINLEVVGRALTRSARLGSFDSAESMPGERSPSSEDRPTTTELDDEKLLALVGDVPVDADEGAIPADEDDLWAAAHLAKRLAAHCWESERVMPKSLKEFTDAAKLARRSSERVFVVLHLFSGANRDFDLECHVRRKLASKNLKVLVISVDLGADLNWDLGGPETFHVLHESVVQGLVDAVCGGPPCSTWSRLRFRPNGPRPLRFRWKPWGRPDVTAAERDRIVEGNTLLVNFMSLCEAIALRGGVYLWEHPKDPGCDPFPSVWATDEYLNFERRIGGHRCR